MNQPWRVLQVITITLSVCLLLLIATVSFDANRDRRTQNTSAALAACRAEQSSTYNQENWTTLAQVLEASVQENEDRVTRLVAEMKSIAPLSVRIAANC